MKHEKISIKWKIFLYLLALAMLLLVVLWLFQICYLDSFYKMIKTREAEKLISEVTAVLGSGDGDIEQQIDTLAAQYNMAVFVADTEGNTIYCAEYIPNSRIGTMPAEMVEQYYKEAMQQGGTAKIEFEGNINKNMPDMKVPQMGRETDGAVLSPNGIDSTVPTPEEDNGFVQNYGQNQVESVIYVNVITVNGQEALLMVNAQLTPVDAIVNTLRSELTAITLIMILLSLVVSLLISRQVSRSLIQITESAKELAGGNFDVTFNGKDYREVAELSDTLTRTAVELGQSERLRRELLANVSHDLRTPLTMIIAYAEVMRDLPGENTPENVQVVIDEAERLTNLVNDMLDTSKLQAGVAEKNVSVYNLTESIQSVFKRYNKLKEQDGYTILFEYDRTVMVEADEYKIFQVIYNLVNNAINYTGEDKTIRVCQKVQDNVVRIEVTDTGEGIAPEALPYVWDRYYKVDKTHKRAVMGTGLGLSIVKNILELHEAKYGVESKPGCGSTFWFELNIVEETAASS